MIFKVTKARDLSYERFLELNSLEEVKNLVLKDCHSCVIYWDTMEIMILA